MLPAGTKLARFEREGEAREPFSTRPGRERRAIAPDAFIEVADADGRALCAFLELDMGTMSHRRLKQKAAGYAEYAKAKAWRERHGFCPALLFLTTTEKRARSFLAAMGRELGPEAMLLTCACELARRPERIASEPRWLLDAEDEEAVDLLAALREARRPHDEALAGAEAQRRCEEAERERLRTDPEALREHLHRWRGRWETGKLEAQAGTAVKIAVERDGPLEEAERRGLLALGALFADPLQLWQGGREPSAAERLAFEDLAEHYRREQLRHVDELAERFGKGPGLREVRERIEAGELLSPKDASWLLRQKAEDDKRSRDEQERLASDYLTWREEEARRRAKAQRPLARLRNGPETFLAKVDRRSLRYCRDCGEVAYPDPKRARHERARDDVAFRCHFCGDGAAPEEIEVEVGGAR